MFKSIFAVLLYFFSNTKQQHPGACACPAICYRSRQKRTRTQAKCSL